MHAEATIRRNHAQGKRRQPIELHFFHLVWIFLICSFIGLAGETVVSFFADGRWESRAGFVIGPFSPIYGLGAVLITVAVNPLASHNLLTQFAAGGIVGGALEYFAGWLLETRYGIVAWSYIDQPFNLSGHTSLLMIVAWGAIGLVWAHWALPATVKLIELIPVHARVSLTVIAFVFIMADSALTLACLDCWFMRTAGVPVETPLQSFCATYFDDEFMQTRFETMSMYTSLARR